MAKNLYQGDPKLYVNEQGSYLIFKGGQPNMDAALENRVVIPLLSRRRSKSNRKPWVGNIAFRNEAYHIGTDFEESHEGALTLTKLDDIKKAGEKALQSMIETNLASDIIVTITNPTAYRLDEEILIKPPNEPISELTLVRNGVNWIIQDQDPPEPDPPDPPEPAPDGFGAYEFGDQYFGLGY